MSFDPNALTPEMSGVRITLGDYHGTMDAAQAARKRVKSSNLSEISKDDLLSLLLSLEKGDSLCEADEDTDVPNFWDAIDLVQKELKNRQQKTPE